MGGGCDLHEYGVVDDAAIFQQPAVFSKSISGKADVSFRRGLRRRGHQLANGLEHYLKLLVVFLFQFFKLAC